MRWFNVFLAWVFGGGLLTQSVPGRCEAHYNWEALLNTRRIAVIAPFFCTTKPPVPLPLPAPAAKPKARIVWPAPTSKQASSREAARSAARKQSAKTTLRPVPVQLDPAPAPPNATPNGKKQSEPSAVTSAEKSFHAQTLQSLTSTMQSALPESIAAGRVYQVVPEGESQAALHALRWQPRDLFKQRGELIQGKFPTPDVKHIQRLAQRLHVDGVLIAAMREPASIGDGLRLPYELWMVNPLNLGIRRIRPHVLSPRVQAFLITAEGEIAWQDEQAADHPRTTPRTLKTLLIDWQEATEQVAQQLADSLHRPPPAKSLSLVRVLKTLAVKGQPGIENTRQERASVFQTRMPSLRGEALNLIPFPKRRE